MTIRAILKPDADLPQLFRGPIQTDPAGDQFFQAESVLSPSLIELCQRGNVAYLSSREVHSHISLLMLETDHVLLSNGTEITISRPSGSMETTLQVKAPTLLDLLNARMSVEAMKQQISNEQLASEIFAQLLLGNNLPIPGGVRSGHCPFLAKTLSLTGIVAISLHGDTTNLLTQASLDALISETILTPCEEGFSVRTNRGFISVALVYRNKCMATGIAALKHHKIPTRTMVRLMKYALVLTYATHTFDRFMGDQEIAILNHAKSRMLRIHNQLPTQS